MKTSFIQHAGLGANPARVNVYIGNRPNYQDLPVIDHLQALNQGDIEQINRVCGNGWRKVFNVYAKLMFAWRSRDTNLNAQLPGAKCENWQAYRDRFLLQGASQTALLFTPPHMNRLLPRSDIGQSLIAGENGPDQGKAIHSSYHIIMGRTYAKSILSDADNVKGLNLTWLDAEFAIDHKHRTVVCPYFDYRQLSNLKIIRLVELLMSLNKAQA